MDVDGSVDRRWTDAPAFVDRARERRGQPLWTPIPSTGPPGAPGAPPGSVPNRTRALTCIDGLRPQNPQALLLLLFSSSWRTTTTVTPDIFW